MKAFVLAVVAAVVIAIGWAGFLDRIQEPGKLGALARVAEGLGAAGLLLSPG